MTQATNRCETCKYWHKQEEHGLCRVKSPIALTGHYKGVWPTTEHMSLCGEYEVDPDHVPEGFVDMSYRVRV